MVGIAAESWVTPGRWHRGKGMKDLLAVPPTQGTGLAGVMDRDGSVPRVFCPGDCARCLNIAWGILDALAIENM